MTATPINALNVLESQTLPNGVKVLIVPCAGYDALQHLPMAVQMDGESYGRTGWNSDRFIAYYRNDAALATY